MIKAGCNRFVSCSTVGIVNVLFTSYQLRKVFICFIEFKDKTASVVKLLQCR